LTELITSPSNVKEIQFNVVTGSVIFGVHDGDNIVVNLYTSAREAVLLDDIDAKVHVKDHVLYIESKSPAFDYDTCQYAYIEVLFPEDITKQTEVSISGKMTAGYVGASILSNLGHVAINVSLGVVEMEGLNAESLTIEAGLGYIWAGSIWTSSNSLFTVGTGSINTQFISSPVFKSEIEYGCNWNTDITANDASVKTAYGYSTLLRPSHFTGGSDQVVKVHTHYGKSIATYQNVYNLDFHISNGHGQSTIVFDNQECALEESEKENVLVGTCPSEVSLSQTSSIKVNTCFGESILVQEEPDFDMLEHNVDVDKINFEEFEDRED
jgi:hypothetical protein